MNLFEAHKQATGLTIEEGIARAIEGGWKLPIGKDYKVVWEEKFGFLIDSFLLDPNYWKCLGNSMGWGKIVEKSKSKYSKECFDCCKIVGLPDPDIKDNPCGQHHWLQFIQLLAKEI